MMIPPTKIPSQTYHADKILLPPELGDSVSAAVLFDVVRFDP